MVERRLPSQELYRDKNIAREFKSLVKGISRRPGSVKTLPTSEGDGLVFWIGDTKAKRLFKYAFSVVGRGVRSYHVCLPEATIVDETTSQINTVFTDYTNEHDPVFPGFKNVIYKSKLVLGQNGEIKTEPMSAQRYWDKAKQLEEEAKGMFGMYLGAELVPEDDEISRVMKLLRESE